MVTVVLRALVLLGLIQACFGLNAGFKVEMPESKPKVRDYRFVVLGATGVGKTSLIQALVAKSTEDLLTPGSGLHAKSMTTKCKIYESDELVLKTSSGMTLRRTYAFMDSMGFGADDHPSESIVFDVYKNVLKSSQSINGIIVVHKADRYRRSSDEDIRIIKNLLKEFSVDHEVVTLVITHSGMLTDKAREKYKKDLLKRLNEGGEFVKPVNTLHVNFPRLDELQEPFQSHLAGAHLLERMRFLKHLEKFTKPFNPVAQFLETEIDELATQNDLLQGTGKEKKWYSVLGF
jgi:GTP-binding protein EngB required for normal cell division